MTVTVFYENGTRACFSDELDARAQACHDQSHPGHVAPVSMHDGDVYDPAAPPLAIEFEDCDCAECAFQRDAPALSGPERAALRARLSMERDRGERT